MNVVRVKKVNCIFEELSETKHMQITPDYSSATAIMLIIFGLNMISALFLIVGIHSTVNF